MFCEAAIANWLSNGNSPNGMIVRLQVNPKGWYMGIIKNILMGDDM